MFVWLVGFLTSSSTIRLYRGRVPRLASDIFTCYHTRDHDFCLSRSHYRPTDTDPISRERRSRRPQRESNPGPPHQQSSSLPTDLPHPRTPPPPPGLDRKFNLSITKNVSLKITLHISSMYFYLQFSESGRIFFFLL